MKAKTEASSFPLPKSQFKKKIKQIVLNNILNLENRAEEPAKVVEDQVRVERETAPIPYVVQPGFNVPKEAGSGRFLLAFGTSTTTSSFTTTVTSTLTATCKSTTAFQLCGSSGK